MNRKVMAVMICLAVVGMMGNAFAQDKTPVAGTTTTPATTEEMVTVANGWSVKNQILGKDVFNDKREKVGEVKDLIVSQDKAISYAIIETGGFVGIGMHDVAIRVNQFKMVDGKITLPGATKETVKAMPAFKYAK